MLGRLHAIDLGVVGLYLIAITAFGLRFARKGTAKDKSLKGYFLADKTVPWWAIALSIVSAETSTLTIIGTPGLAFAGDFGFLQIVMGYMLGRVVVAAIFLPRYFHGEMLTAYQLIDRRFGRTLYKTTAGLFLLTRAAAEGVRVFAVSIVVAIAIGTGDVLSIAIISGLTLLYTFEGGMAAVIWTDVVQMAIYVGGSAVALWSVGAHVPGGWHHIHAIAGAAGKFRLWDFAWSLTRTYTFWAGVLGGTFLTMASHGTDQLMVQRMLAARNLRESRMALLSSGVVIFVQFAMFLLIGAGLWVFYGTHPGALTAIGGANGNRIFPGFIVTEMPVGIAGLLVAAILAAAMSNLSAALNSLSSTTVVDFYMGWKPNAGDSERMLISRASTVMWALVLFAVAVYSVKAGGKGNVVEIGLSIASVAYGCLLGVFLLGTLTKYATQTGAIIGMICGFTVNLLLWKWPGHGIIPNVAWTWYVLIGAAATFIIGSAASFLMPRRRTPTRSEVAATLLLLVILSGASRLCDAQSKDPDAAKPTTTVKALSASNSSNGANTYDFSAVSADIDKAIADRKLPGAVVLVGHNGKVVFEQAYGVRKYAGEPGVDGKPSPAEPMTLDTIFDMASLSKCLATATSIMQLVEQGKIDVDAPVVKYLPEFAITPNPNSASAPDTNSTPGPTANSATTLSANGATIYQPGAKPQVEAPNRATRAEGPTYTSFDKAKVTVRELLTHYSGLPPDVNLKDSWGLAKPDKAEGIRRAMEAKLVSTPGTHFEYSDINFITLGAIVEKVSGERLDVYAQEHVFGQIGMTNTRYLPFDRACGSFDAVGSAIVGKPNHTSERLPDGRSATQVFDSACPPPRWMPFEVDQQIAPTQHDNEGTAETNPDFDHLLRGTVHDPTTRRMGGVAGHAGVFSTAEDMSRYAQALLDKLLHNTGPFPLEQSTLQMMVRPEQPSTAENTGTVFTQDGQPTKGVALRGFGWDINSAFSRPRGTIFPVGISFGHTGFTGTSLWIDPVSDTYVVLLANSVHPRGASPISPLRGQVATDAAKALGVSPNAEAPSSDPGPKQPVSLEGTAIAQGFSPGSQVPQDPSQDKSALAAEGIAPQPEQSQLGSKTSTGIDVLESDHFRELKALAANHGGKLRVGLLTNQTGLDSHGRRTIDVLRNAGDGIELVRLFSPEHGIFGAKDTENIGQEIEPGIGLKVTSLYGPKDSDKRPKTDDLKDLDAVVIDLQDAGVRFYTYETVTGYFVEASACEAARGHQMAIVVLDRPALIGGEAVQGPVSDTKESYINYMPEPVRNGMTLGELAGYMRAEHPGSCGETSGVAAGFSPREQQPLKPQALASGSSRPSPGPSSSSSAEIPSTDSPAISTADVEVVRMQHWHRSEFFDETGVHWINPSPNLRTMTGAILYPGLGMLDATNVSVGRGTDAPFEIFGAAWIDGPKLAGYLNARHIPGVEFSATTFAVRETSEKYPGHGQTISGVRMKVTDRNALDSPEMGIEILSALHKLYPAEFQLAKAAPLVANTETMDRLTRGDDPRQIAAGWQPALKAFEAKRRQFLLYP